MYKYNKMIAVKMPVFSNKKLPGVDVALGPEMKSTGEVLGVDFDMDKAMYKAFKAAGSEIYLNGTVYISVSDIDKKEALPIAAKYSKLGFNILCSEGTYDLFSKNGLECSKLKIEDAIEKLKNKRIDIVINTPTVGYKSGTPGFELRHTALAHDKLIFTCLNTADIYTNCINVEKNKETINYRPMEEYLN